MKSNPLLLSLFMIPVCVLGQNWNAGAYQFGGGNSGTSGSGGGQACYGYAPYLCARSDTAPTLNANGLPTNGPLFSTGPVNTVTIDPFFGERVIRITDGNTASNASGHSWGIPNAGWIRNSNCAGTNNSVSCASGTFMFAVGDQTAGAGNVIYALNPSTMALSRVDNSLFTGPKILNTSNGYWSGVDPDKYYASLQKNETSSLAANFETYEFNPSVPGTPAPTLVLNLNTGPLGAAFDQQTGSGGLISALNGILKASTWALPIAPIVCDTTACVETGATPSGTTCGTASGGTAGAGCVDVSNSTGSLVGKFSFAFTQDDGGSPVTEQNLSGESGIGSLKVTSYTFTTGEVTGVTAPTKIVSPTAVNWNFYVAGPGLQWTSTAVSLAPLQFKVVYATATSCPGTGCPTFPLTTLVSTTPSSGQLTSLVSASNHMNYSCANGNCEIALTGNSADDTLLYFLTGGIGQGVQPLVLAWSPTMGARWLDLTTGVVHNGATDANGNSCPAVTCWSSTGSGAITFHPDPNAPTSSQVFGGLLLHDIINGLDGEGQDPWVQLSNQISPASNDAEYWWHVNTGDVYVCAKTSTAGNCTGHPLIGWAGTGGYIQTATNATVNEGNFQLLARTLNNSTAGGCGTVGSGTPCIQQSYSFLTLGACPTIGQPCAYPAPNYSTTSWTGIGSGRADSHGSMLGENPSNTYPFVFAPFINAITFSLSTTAASQTRTGCPASCVDTFKVANSGQVDLLPGDLVAITGLADSSFNITCNVATIPVYSGSTFTCNDPGKSNATTQGQTGGGNVYKVDDSPGRGWEGEMVAALPSPNSSVNSPVYRISHTHFDILGNGAATGPNGSISPNGKYAFWTTTDGSGGAPTCAVGSISGAGGSGYAVNDTATINNVAANSTLATVTVTSVSGGVVTGVSCSGGTLYTLSGTGGTSFNWPTTTVTGVGSGLVVNITAVTAGRTDAAIGELR